MLMTDFCPNIVFDLESPITILTQTSSESQIESASEPINLPLSPILQPSPYQPHPPASAEFLQSVPYISPASPARFTCMEFRMANRYSVISRVPEKFRKPTTQVTPRRGHSRAAALAPFLRERDTNGRKSAVALAFEEMRTPHASWREICVQKFGNAYQRKEVEKRMPHFFFCLFCFVCLFVWDPVAFFCVRCTHRFHEFACS